MENNHNRSAAPRKTAARPAIIIGVRFMAVGKIYHFDASAYPQIKPGDRVIVETARGHQLGEVVALVEASKIRPPDEGYKSIEDIATPRDLVQYQYWQSKEPEALVICRERAAQLDLPGTKVVRAEYSYDGARLTFFVCSPEEEGKTETKSLKDDMQSRFPGTQVTLRPIGPRDAAKQPCGLGACWVEQRCCCRFLTEFSPVSIKMAKEQGISLNPEEITGICGRLRCCLVYEYELYADLRKTLPKRNKHVTTPKGPGKVIDVNPLKETILVAVRESEEVTRLHEFARSEWQLAPDPEPPKKKPGEGKSRRKGKPAQPPGNDQPPSNGQPPA